jgi:hypothetical protein
VDAAGSGRDLRTRLDDKVFRPAGLFAYMSDPHAVAAVWPPLAQLLQGHPRVRTVPDPGLPDHPHRRDPLHARRPMPRYTLGLSE